MTVQSAPIGPEYFMFLLCSTRQSKCQANEAINVSSGASLITKEILASFSTKFFRTFHQPRFPCFVYLARDEVTAERLRNFKRDLLLTMLSLSKLDYRFMRLSEESPLKLCKGQMLSVFRRRLKSWINSSQEQIRDRPCQVIKLR